jgi:hypothetical protein
LKQFIDSCSSSSITIDFIEDRVIQVEEISDDVTDDFTNDVTGEMSSVGATEEA